MARSNSFLKHVPFSFFTSGSLRARGLYHCSLKPIEAAQWMALNVRNRRIRSTLVAYLKRQAEKGEWQHDHPQPIVFSDIGRLIDGQHRLLAIAGIEATDGATFGFRVETGASDSIREYLDTGISRTLEDRVELVDDPSVNKLASQIISVSLVLIPGSKSARYGKVTPEDAREFWVLHGDAILLVAVLHKRDRGVGQTAVAYAAMEYFERDASKAEEFYADLFVPAGRVQQAQMLRDALLRVADRNSGGFMIRREAYHKAVGCMKAHLTGREVKQVRMGMW